MVEGRTTSPVAPRRRLAKAKVKQLSKADDDALRNNVNQGGTPDDLACPESEPVPPDLVAGGSETFFREGMRAVGKCCTTNSNEFAPTSTF